MNLVHSAVDRNIYRENNQIIVEWTFANGYIESLDSELLAIVKDTPFGEESTGFYVTKDLPEYGLMQACKIPVQKHDFVVDLDF